MFIGGRGEGEGEGEGGWRRGTSGRVSYQDVHHMKF